MNLNLWPQAQTERGLQPQIISSYSRGCKMDCSFCYRTTPQERAKSPEKLDAELSVLKAEHNIEFVFFVDLTFTSHKKQTMEILDVIKKHDIRWTCLTRCADIDKDRAEAMADSGCDIALFGVESLGKDVLKEARKGQFGEYYHQSPKNRSRSRCPVRRFDYRRSSKRNRGILRSHV